MYLLVISRHTRPCPARPRPNVLLPAPHQPQIYSVRKQTVTLPTPYQSHVDLRGVNVLNHYDNASDVFNNTSLTSSKSTKHQSHASPSDNGIAGPHRGWVVAPSRDPIMPVPLRVATWKRRPTVITAWTSDGEDTLSVSPRRNA
eukprot:superscaffoldBa00001735_g11795